MYAMFLIEVRYLRRNNHYEENNRILVCMCVVNAVLAAQGENCLCSNE
jgi:hypothetical protein